ncbi:MAG: hypothetical protein Q9207_001807 [Kuettlingeria erythrocarpa]
MPSVFYDILRPLIIFSGGAFLYGYLMKPQQEIIDLLKGLKEDMKDMKADIRDIKADIRDIKADIKDLKSDNREHRTFTKNVEAEIWLLKRELATLKKLAVQTLGNSAIARARAQGSSRRRSSG